MSSLIADRQEAIRAYDRDILGVGGEGADVTADMVGQNGTGLVDGSGMQRLDYLAVLFERARGLRRNVR